MKLECPKCKNDISFDAYEIDMYEGWASSATYCNNDNCDVDRIFIEFKIIVDKIEEME